MTSSSARGYDDTKELMEMAVGIFDGRFKSVDHAARSVLPDPKQSNVDRLRRKFREQDWMDKGREEFLRQSLEPDRAEASQPARHSDAEYLRAIRLRLRHPMDSVTAILTKDVFWNAFPVQLMFHIGWLLLLGPAMIVLSVTLGFGTGEEFTYWHPPIFLVGSVISLLASLAMLEEYQGFPSLISHGSGTGHKDEPGMCQS
jgi:hypothetical protein